jgi:hypothetical protein
MVEAPAELLTYDDLRAYIHRTLCDKENLLLELFQMDEAQLVRRGRLCGLQFLLRGPRNVRLGAIWALDHNLIYFYDARGERYLKVKVTRRLVEAQKVA